MCPELTGPWAGASGSPSGLSWGCRATGPCSCARKWVGVSPPAAAECEGLAPRERHRAIEPRQYSCMQASCEAWGAFVTRNTQP